MFDLQPSPFASKPLKPKPYIVVSIFFPYITPDMYIYIYIPYHNLVTSRLLKAQALEVTVGLFFQQGLRNYKHKVML